MTSEPVGPEPTPLTSAQQEELLSTGELSIVGRVIDSSNGTYVVEVTDGDTYTWAIYKPQSGERPLWDFDPGLYKRERAAYVLSEALGWSLVPPTMVRADAPLGVGSLQWYIECDPSMHYFNLLRHAPDTHDALRRMAVFDMVGNNTDRKGGHVLQSADGHVWGIDHGLCFAAEYKLRTVISSRSTITRTPTNHSPGSRPSNHDWASPAGGTSTFCHPPGLPKPRAPMFPPLL